MKKLFKKLTLLAIKIDSNFNKDNKKLQKKLTKCLEKIYKNKDDIKTQNLLLKTSKKLKKKLKNYVFNKKQEKLLEKILNVKEKSSEQAVNNFWNELVITQMAAGRGISVITPDMKKSMNGDKKATQKIMNEIDVRKAAYQGFFYLRNLHL